MIQKEPKYFLGIDWGGKLCGLAIADDETLLATSRGSVATEGLVLAVDALAEEVDLEKIIIGLSEERIFRDNQSLIGEAVGALKGKGYAVETESENFTTRMARENLSGRGKKVSKDDNGEAARIILQSWLDK